MGNLDAKHFQSHVWLDVVPAAMKHCDRSEFRPLEKVGGSIAGVLGKWHLLHSWGPFFTVEG